tara:strand:- start:46 stop:306 length:261 start_codon:yes stop_codon:yes gene_type:complete
LKGQKRVRRIFQQGRISPDTEASISESGLRISPLKRLVPDKAELLASKVVGLLPHIKITDLLAQVDQWTGFTKQFFSLATSLVHQR